MKNKTTLAFAGSVTKNKCTCSECKDSIGKWEMNAFLVQPGKPDQYLVSAGNFETEAEAIKELDGFIEHVAHKVLSETGLDQLVKRSEKVTGPDAEKRARQFVNEGRTDLH